MMPRFLILITLALLATGCASTGMSPEAEVAYIQAQQKLQGQPLIDLELDTKGRLRGLTLNRQSPQVRQPEIHTPGVEAARIGAGIIGTAIPYAAGVYAVDSVMDTVGDMQGDRTVTTTTTETTETSETTTRGDTFGPRADVAGRDVRGPGDDIGRDNIGGDRIDRTSDPTVVEQPAPTVVEQPAPTVVEQPAAGTER